MLSQNADAGFEGGLPSMADEFSLSRAFSLTGREIYSVHDGKFRGPLLIHSTPLGGSSRLVVRRNSRSLLSLSLSLCCRTDMLVYRSGNTLVLFTISKREHDVISFPVGVSLDTFAVSAKLGTITCVVSCLPSGVAALAARLPPPASEAPQTGALSSHRVLVYQHEHAQTLLTLNATLTPRMAAAVPAATPRADAAASAGGGDAAAFDDDATPMRVLSYSHVAVSRCGRRMVCVSTLARPCVQYWSIDEDTGTNNGVGGGGGDDGGDGASDDDNDGSMNGGAAAFTLRPATGGGSEDGDPGGRQGGIAVRLLAECRIPAVAINSATAAAAAAAVNAAAAASASSSLSSSSSSATAAASVSSSASSAIEIAFVSFNPRDASQFTLGGPAGVLFMAFERGYTESHISYSCAAVDSRQLLAAASAASRVASAGKRRQRKHHHNNHQHHSSNSHHHNSSHNNNTLHASPSATSSLSAEAAAVRELSSQSIMSQLSPPSTARTLASTSTGAGADGGGDAGNGGDADGDGNGGAPKPLAHKHSSLLSAAAAAAGGVGGGGVTVAITAHCWAPGDRLLCATTHGHILSFQRGDAASNAAVDRGGSGRRRDGSAAQRGKQVRREKSSVSPNATNALDAAAAGGGGDDDGSEHGGARSLTATAGSASTGGNGNALGATHTRGAAAAALMSSLAPATSANATDAAVGGSGFHAQRANTDMATAFDLNALEEELVNGNGGGGGDGGGGDGDGGDGDAASNTLPRSTSSVGIQSGAFSAQQFVSRRRLVTATQAKGGVSMRVVATAHNGAITCIALTRARLVVGCDDGVVRWLGAERYEQQLAQQLHTHPCALLSIAFGTSRKAFVAMDALGRVSVVRCVAVSVNDGDGDGGVGVAGSEGDAAAQVLAAADDDGVISGGGGGEGKRSRAASAATRDGDRQLMSAHHFFLFSVIVAARTTPLPPPMPFAQYPFANDTGAAAFSNASTSSSSSSSSMSSTAASLPQSTLTTTTYPALPLRPPAASSPLLAAAALATRLQPVCTPVAQAVHVLHAPESGDVAVHGPASRVVTFGTDGGVAVRHYRSGEMLGWCQLNEQAGVSSLASSHDGLMLAVGTNTGVLHILHVAYRSNGGSGGGGGGTGGGGKDASGGGGGDGEHGAKSATAAATALASSLKLKLRIVFSERVYESSPVTKVTFSPCGTHLITCGVDTVERPLHLPSDVVQSQTTTTAAAAAAAVAVDAPSSATSDGDVATPAPLMSVSRLFFLRTASLRLTGYVDVDDAVSAVSFIRVPAATVETKAAAGDNDAATQSSSASASSSSALHRLVLGTHSKKMILLRLPAADHSYTVRDAAATAAAAATRSTLSCAAPASFAIDDTITQPEVYSLDTPPIGFTSLSHCDKDDFADDTDDDGDVGDGDSNEAQKARRAARAAAIAGRKTNVRFAVLGNDSALRTYSLTPATDAAAATATTAVSSSSFSSPFNQFSCVSGDPVSVGVAAAAAADAVAPGDDFDDDEFSEGADDGTPLCGHSKRGGVLAGSPDGDLIATGGVDGVILVRRSAVLNQCLVINAHSATAGGVASIAFTRDSKYVVSSGLDGGVMLWNVSALAPFATAALTSHLALRGGVNCVTGRRQPGMASAVLSDRATRRQNVLRAPRRRAAAAGGDASGARAGGANGGNGDDASGIGGGGGSASVKILLGDDDDDDDVAVPTLHAAAGGSRLGDATTLLSAARTTLTETSTTLAAETEELSARLAAVRARVGELMSANDGLQEYEQLDMMDFVVNSSAQRAALARADAASVRVREQTRLRNAGRRLLASRIKTECHDEMDTPQQTSTQLSPPLLLTNDVAVDDDGSGSGSGSGVGVGIGSDGATRAVVHNFAVCKETNAQRLRTQRVLYLRKMAILEERWHSLHRQDADDASDGDGDTGGSARAVVSAKRTLNNAAATAGSEDGDSGDDSGDEFGQRRRRRRRGTGGDTTQGDDVDGDDAGGGGAHSDLLSDGIGLGRFGDLAAVADSTVVLHNTAATPEYREKAAAAMAARIAASRSTGGNNNNSGGSGGGGGAAAKKSDGGGDGDSHGDGLVDANNNAAVTARPGSSAVPASTDDAVFEWDDEIDDVRLLEHPIMCFTHHRKITQVVLLQRAVAAIKASFNERQTDVREQRREEVAVVRKREARICEICVDLKLDDDGVAEISDDTDAASGDLFIVRDDEVLAERRYTQVEEAARAAASASADDVDDAPQRALWDMMRGELTTKATLTETVLPPRPLWMDETPENGAFTDKQKVEIDAFDAQCAEITAQRELQRRLLETELKKLRGEVAEICRTFDARLSKLSAERLNAQASILRHEYWSLSLVSDLFVESQVQHVDTLFERRMTQLRVEAQTSSDGVVAFKRDLLGAYRRYEQMQVEDRALDRNFRRDFQDAGVHVDALYRLFKSHQRRGGDRRRGGAAATTSPGSAPGTADGDRVHLDTVGGGGGSGDDGGVPQSGDAAALAATLASAAVATEDPFLDALLDEAAVAAERSKQRTGSSSPRRNKVRGVGGGDDERKSRGVGDALAAKALVYAPLTPADMPSPDFDMLVWLRLLKRRQAKIRGEWALRQQGQLVVLMQQHLTDAEAAASGRGTHAAALAERRYAFARRRRALRLNTELLLCMRQGLVEVDESPVVTDQLASELVPRRTVEVLNDAIGATGSENVAVLRQMMASRNTITSLAWHGEYLDLQHRGAVDLTIELQLLRVTKNLQALIKAGGHDNRSAAEVSVLERKVSHLRQVTAIEAIERRKGLMRVQVKSRTQQRENERLRHAVMELEKLVEERKQIRRMAEAGTDSGVRAEAARRRQRFVAERRKMIDIARIQQEDMAVLRRERDRLRSRTFPSFAHMRHTTQGGGGGVGVDVKPSSVQALPGVRGALVNNYVSEEKKEDGSGGEGLKLPSIGRGGATRPPGGASSVPAKGRGGRRTIDADARPRPLTQVFTKM
jgi:WD40 repeat protein